MIPSGFIVIALLLNGVGAGIYIYRTARRQIHPHIVTWSMWAVAPYVVFFAQLSDGVRAQSLTTLFVGTSPLIVVVLVLFLGERVWSVTVYDLVCGLLSVIGIVAWALSRRAQYAVAFAIAADAFAAVPTFRKAWRDPASESWVNFGCLAVSALITLATIRTWSPAPAAFAIYLAILGCSMVLVQFTARRRRRPPAPLSEREGRSG